jgi:hypothetical protein
MRRRSGRDPPWKLLLPIANPAPLSAIPPVHHPWDRIGGYRKALPKIKNLRQGIAGGFGGLS